jgi:hypothetical protein
MTRCKECQKLFTDMHAHLRKHKMTVAEYNLKHNDYVRSGVTFIRLHRTAAELDNMQYIVDSKERNRKRKLYH